MTDQQHPITPPLDLIEQWHNAWIDAKVKHDGLVDFVAIQAARWGSDQELEACCEWIETFADFGDLLRRDRRSEPLSLKEHALEAFQKIETNIPQSLKDFEACCEVIRRALEQLDD